MPPSLSFALQQRTLQLDDEMALMGTSMASMTWHSSTHRALRMAVVNTSMQRRLSDAFGPGEPAAAPAGQVDRLQEHSRERGLLALAPGEFRLAVWGFAGLRRRPARGEVVPSGVVRLHDRLPLRVFLITPLDFLGCYRVAFAAVRRHEDDLEIERLVVTRAH